MVTTIAVPLDGSPLAERALLYAEALVRKTGAKLIVVHARPALAPTWEPRFEPGPVAGRLHSSGVDAEAQVCLIYGDETARAICEAGKERRADLIIMSTHGHGGLRRWGYGSVADAVLRLAQMPVLLVPATCQRPWPTDLVLRILVPLDGLAPAEDVLGPIGDLAQAIGAQVLLLRVVSDSYETYRPAGAPPGAPPLLPEQAAAEHYLARIALRLQLLAGNLELLAVAGKTVPTIVRIARERSVDLIAMATQARAGIGRLVLGSTAAGVLDQASLPLLLVGPAAAPWTARRTVSPLAVQNQRNTVGGPVERAEPDEAEKQEAAEIENWRPALDP